MRIDIGEENVKEVEEFQYICRQIVTNGKSLKDTKDQSRKKRLLFKSIGDSAEKMYQFTE